MFVCEPVRSQFLVLESGGETYAVPIHKAREIVPIAKLMSVPGGSKLLVGFLNLRGTAVPVVRVEPPTSESALPPGLYAQILIFLDGGRSIGILVDAVREIVDAAEEAIAEHNSRYAFNACVTGVIQSTGRTIPVLSTDLLLLANERLRITEFQMIAQARMSGLEGASFRGKELEAILARTERESAEARALLAGELTIANQELERANRKLKMTQMHLVQSEKMASLGQLVAGIAHEINNPLAFVLNHLFTIESALASAAAEVTANVSEAAGRKFQKARTRLEEMREGLNRVKDLVSNLRTFSRLDEGEVKTIDLHESIDSVLRLLQYKLNGRIKLEKRYGVVPLCDCYAGQFNQVMMNLIANAIDAIEDKGTITISTRAEDEQVVVSVRDTGSGIPEAIQNRIFDPFFTTKPVGSGTGLGLAISYQIVQAHGGTIEVRSKAGEGAEFTVCIPLKLKLAANEAETISTR